MLHTLMLNPEKVKGMQEKGKRVYEAYLKHEFTLVETLVETVKARMIEFKRRVAEPKVEEMEVEGGGDGAGV